MPACPALVRALRHRHRHQRGEEGFTLIEMLIVLVVMPIVVGGVAVAIITSLQDQQGLQTRLSDSSDAVISSAFFPRDAQSAADVTTNRSANSPAPCSASGATPVFSLEWGVGTSLTVVTYATEPVPGSTELIRLSCTPNYPGSSTNRAVMSHGASATGATLAISCVSTDPTCASAAGSAWLPASDVSNLTVNVTQSSGYQYTLAAAPMSGPQITPASPGAGALLLLGKGTDVTYSFGLNTGDTVTVNGTVDLDSDAAAQQGIPATIQFDSSNSSLTSVANSTTGSAAGVDVWNCGSNFSNGQACPGATVSNCNYIIFQCSGNNVKPGPTNLTGSVADPLAGWAQGNAPVEANAAASCQRIGSTYNCPPGLYQSIPTFSGVTVNFDNPNNKPQPLVYSFTTQVTFGGGDTVNFGAGIYSFYGNSGLDDGGVFASSNTLNGSGVLFYFTGNSSADFSGGQANKVNLSAPSSGTYKGLLMWEDTDAQTLNLSGFGLGQPSTDSYNGNIYAPNAEVSIDGFGDSITTGPIIAQSLGLIGSASTVTIG